MTVACSRVWLQPISVRSGPRPSCRHMASRRSTTTSLWSTPQSPMRASRLWWSPCQPSRRTGLPCPGSRLPMRVDNKPFVMLRLWPAKALKHSMKCCQRAPWPRWTVILPRDMALKLMHRWNLPMLWDRAFTENFERVPCHRDPKG